VVSAHECAASASMALDRVSRPAPVFAIAMTRFTANASSTVLLLSDAMALRAQR